MQDSTIADQKIVEIGAQTLRDLAGMNIPPRPTFYHVWFTHLEHSNDALSAEIEQKLGFGEVIDGYFLKLCYEKYFSGQSASQQIEKFTFDVLKETNSLKELSGLFTTNTQIFTAELKGVSDNFDAALEGNEAGAKVLSVLAQAAQNAISRNDRLEQELNVASEKITTLQASIETIAKDAKTDFLTNLTNRRYFDSAFSELIKNARDENDPLCLIISDIDHFKSFNDRWGHPVGDQVLKLVASVLQENVKGQDLVARYGGEEFAIAAPHTALNDAVKLADNIRMAVAKRKLINRATNENLGRVTMSFGVAQLTPQDTAETIYASADAALYEAKAAGRDKVISFKAAQAVA